MITSLSRLYLQVAFVESLLFLAVPPPSCPSRCLLCVCTEGPGSMEEANEKDKAIQAEGENKPIAQQDSMSSTDNAQLDTPTG